MYSIEYLQELHASTTSEKISDLTQLETTAAPTIPVPVPVPVPVDDEDDEDGSGPPTVPWP